MEIWTAFYYHEFHYEPLFKADPISISIVWYGIRLSRTLYGKLCFCNVDTVDATVQLLMVKSTGSKRCSLFCSIIHCHFYHRFLILHPHFSPKTDSVDDYRHWNSSEDRDSEGWKADTGIELANIQINIIELLNVNLQLFFISSGICILFGPIFRIRPKTHWYLSIVFRILNSWQALDGDVMSRNVRCLFGCSRLREMARRK